MITEIKVDKIKKQCINAWKKGNDHYLFESNLDDIKFAIPDCEIEI